MGLVGFDFAQETMNGTWMPPSQAVAFFPLCGKSL